MKRLLLVLILLALPAGLAFARGGLLAGGFFVGPPTTPVTIVFVPSPASVSDASGTGAQVATIAVTMADASQFSGTLAFCSSGCGPNNYGNGGNLWAIAGPANAKVNTAVPLAPANDGTYHVTIKATQNGVSVWADLTISVVPSGAGIACDQGPVYAGTLPADVNSAFNPVKCLVNADYATTTTDTNGINYSDVTTWISECGAADHTYNWHVTFWFHITSPNPCPTGNNNVNIVSDPLGGGFNVFHMVYRLADQTRFINACIALGAGQGTNNCAPGFDYDSINLNWPAVGQANPGLPIEMYKETTFYMPASALNSGVSGHSGRVSPSNSDVSSSFNHFIAADQFEINPSPCSGGFDDGCTTWSWDIGIGVETAPNAIVSSRQQTGSGVNFASGYNVIGQLITSDGISQVSACVTINGTLQGGTCLYYDLSTDSSVPLCSGGGYACYFNHNSKVLMSFLPLADSCFPWTYTTNPPTACLHNDVDIYYKSIRVFSCTGYKSGPCPGPIITSSNEPLRRYVNDNPEGLIRQAVSWLIGKAA